MAKFILMKVKSMTRKIDIKEKLFITFAIAPVITYFIVFMYYPFAMNFVYMFCKYDFLSKPEFVGLVNIQKFISDGASWGPFRNTFTITLAAVPIIVIVSLLLAMALFHMKIGKSFCRSAIFTSYITSLIVAATIFKMLFGNELGFINSTIEYFGGQKIPWLLQPETAIFAVIVMTVWKYLGYYTVIFLAGFSNLNAELSEASKIDGANAVKSFWYVIIPQLKPTIVFSTIIATIEFLRTYPTVIVLTNGGPYSSTKTILMYMFEQGFHSRNVGYASVIAVALFTIIFIITIIQLKVSDSYSEGA